MPLTLCSRAIVATFFVACLFLALPAGSAENDPARPIPPDTPDAADAGDVDRARALIDAGRFTDAVAILRPLLDGEVIEANTLFLYGLAVMGAARQAGVPADTRAALLDQAISSFHKMLVKAPGLVRVRLELARAFFYKGEDGLSKEHFERVLAGDPPAAVAANVRRFLSRIRARRRWNMHFGFALAPDTNIGGVSGDEFIYIFGLPFRRNERDLPTSGVGLAVWSGGEYQHPLGDKVRLRLGVNANRREYSGGKFDRMLLSGHMGPRVLATRGTEFSVLGDWRYQWTANEPDYFDVGGRLLARHRLGRRVTLNGRASWHQRRYRTRKSLDGPVRSISLGGAWVVTPTVRFDLTAGLGGDRPESVSNRNESKWLQAGVSVALPLGFTVGGSGGYRWTDYEGPGFLTIPSRSPRKDETWNVRGSVFNRAFTLFGFSPQVSVVHEVRTTNAQALGYKRTSGELRFVRQF